MKFYLLSLGIVLFLFSCSQDDMLLENIATNTSDWQHENLNISSLTVSLDAKATIKALDYAGGYYDGFIDNVEFIGENTTTAIGLSGSIGYRYTAPGQVYSTPVGSSIIRELPEKPLKVRLNTSVFSIDNPYLYFDVTVNILGSNNVILGSKRIMINDETEVEIEISDEFPFYQNYTISLDITPDLSYGYYSQLTYYCSVIDLDYTNVSKVDFTVDRIDFDGWGDINNNWPAYEWLYGETKSHYVQDNETAFQIYMFDQQAPLLFPTLKSISSSGRITTDVPVNFIDLEVRIHGTNQVLYSEKFSNLTSTTTWEYSFFLDVSDYLQQKYDIAILAAVNNFTSE